MSCRINLLCALLGRIYPKVQLCYHFINLSVTLRTEYTRSHIDLLWPCGKIHPKVHAVMSCRINLLCALLGRIYSKGTAMLPFYQSAVSLWVEYTRSHIDLLCLCG